MIADLVGKRVLVKLPGLSTLHGQVIRMVPDDPTFPLVVRVDGHARSELPVRLAEVLLDE